MGNGYWSGLERPIAWCKGFGCGRTGAREAKSDGLRLCKACRAEVKAGRRCRVCLRRADAWEIIVGGGCTACTPSVGVK